MARLWSLALLCYYCASSHAYIGKYDGNNAWVYPHDTDVQLTSRFARSAVLYAGDISTLIWYTNVTTSYQVDLLQQNLTIAQATNTGMTVFRTTSSPGNNTFNWSTEVPAGVRTDLSNVFFLSLYGPEISINSPYFNITYESATPSSASASLSTSTTQSTATSSASTTTTSSPSPTNSDVNGATSSQSGADSTALKVGLGVGLGVGIPLVLGVAFLIYRTVRKSGARRSPPRAGYAFSEHSAYHDGQYQSPASQIEKVNNKSSEPVTMSPSELDGIRPHYELPGR